MKQRKLNSLLWPLGDSTDVSKVLGIYIITEESRASPWGMEKELCGLFLDSSRPRLEVNSYCTKKKEKLHTEEFQWGRYADYFLVELFYSFQSWEKNF